MNLLASKPTLNTGAITEVINGIILFAIIIIAIVAFIFAFDRHLKKNDRKEQSYHRSNSTEIKPQTKSHEKAEAKHLGEIGEKIIADILSDLPHPSRILRNLYIPKENGETTEIDLVFINSNGIFVIESKNYKGWIFGTIDQKQWTVKYLGGETQRLFNPIWQNRSHLKRLQEQLKGIPEDLFHSLIVFGSESEIKTELGELEPREEVLYTNEIREYVKLQKIYNKAELSEEEIELIASSLENRFCNQDESIKLKHVEALESRKNNRNYVEKKITEKEKCIICGNPATCEELCRSCIKELKYAFIQGLLEEDDEEEEEEYVEEEPEEKEGCGAKIIYSLATLGGSVLLIIIILIISLIIKQNS